ncbi:MAG: hypothetical protein CMJ99_09240 [Planctomycetes bacterium]|nr:hypothetical protein [Planctomycetota bacterium]
MKATRRFRTPFALALGLALLSCDTTAASPEATAGNVGPRYPSDLAISPCRQYIFTANRSSRSLSIIEITSGKVLDETSLGKLARPAQVLPFRHSGELQVAVSDDSTHCVKVFSVAASSPHRLRLVRSIKTGRSPRGLAYISSLGQLLVACSADHQVNVLDPVKDTAIAVIATVEGVRHLRVIDGAPGDNRPLVAATGRREVTLIDPGKRASLGRTTLSNGRGLNFGGLVSNGSDLFLSHQVQPTQVAIDPEMIVWGLILANRVTKIPIETLATPSPPEKEASPPSDSGDSFYGGYQGGVSSHSVFPLDQRHRANGDPGKPALARLKGSPGQLLLLPSGGTNRLLFIEPDEAYLPGTEPLSRQDAIPSIPVGKRPVAVACSPDSDRAYVLCSLEDSIWEIDIRARKVTRKLRLGPTPKPTRKHLGAGIFFSSMRSRGGWYSCHSCHPEGGSSGHAFDTHADGDGLAKKAPDLHGVLHTAPWAWNGKFRTLEAQVGVSLHTTMAVNEPPSQEDVDSILAFIGSLEPAPPHYDSRNLGGDPLRGATIFEKADCSRCHKPPYYTVPSLKDVGVFDEYDGNREFNPPSLLGVRDRGRYLHDGRAKSLRSVFTKHDKEKKHGKTRALSPEEFEDLLAFLQTL